MGCGTSNLPLISAASSLDTNVGKPLFPLPTKYSSLGLPTSSTSKRRSFNTNNNALNVKEKLALSSTETANYHNSTQNLSNFENLSLNNNNNEGYSPNSHQNGHKNYEKNNSIEENGSPRSSCSDESSEYSSDGHLECRWIRSHFSQSILSSQTSFKKTETREFKSSGNQKVSLVVLIYHK